MPSFPVASHSLFISKINLDNLILEIEYQLKTSNPASVFDAVTNVTVTPALHTDIQIEFHCRFDQNWYVFGCLRKSNEVWKTMLAQSVVNGSEFVVLKSSFSENVAFDFRVQEIGNF